MAGWTLACFLLVASIASVISASSAAGGGGTLTTKPSSAAGGGGTLTTKPSSAAGGGGTLTTKPCDATDPSQSFVFDPASGELSSIYGGGGRRCAVVAGADVNIDGGGGGGCNLATNAGVTLGACGGGCAKWALARSPHPVSPAATFITAPGDPAGEPRCLERPNGGGADAVDIYCCSGSATNCGGAFPSALPWQQWAVAAVAAPGQVKNLAEGTPACLAVALAPPPPVTAVPVWPIPQHVECGGGPSTAALLSSSVEIEVTGADSDVASAAAKRYQALLQAAGTSGGGVIKVSVHVGGDAPLSRDTDFAYSLVQPAGGTAVAGTAATGFGVAHAMETLLQLAEDDSGCTAAGFNVTDAPDFPHRGLMIDTGRRFYPVALVEQILEGMAMMKMSVMHMFLSELCFRVESKKFPGLHSEMNCTGPNPRPGLVNNGYYTQAQIANLVDFARLRGIRLIPEFDMPGHSGGFCHGLKSAGIVCCGDGGMGVPQIQDDPAGKSAAVVKQVLQEMSTLFPDSVLNIGGDETGATPPCDAADTKSFEVKMIDYVQNGLGKEVMGWEELVFKTGAADGVPSVIIDSWARSSWQQAASLGHRTIVSNSGTFYLDYHGTFAPALWIDIRGDTTNTSLLDKLLGGEASMWQDFYVPGARSKAVGSASCLFDDSRDADFSNSTAATIWPRTAIAGGAFWHFDGSLDRSSPLFATVLEAIKRRLAKRGIGGCPCATTTAIGCDQNSHCGHVFCPNG